MTLGRSDHFAVTRPASALAAVGLLAGVVACDGGDSDVALSTTVAPTTVVAPTSTVAEADETNSLWAAEAQDWHDSLRAAQIAEGGAAFSRYLSPDVVWDGRGAYADAGGPVRTGASAIADAAVLLGPESVRIEPEIFLGVDGLVSFAFYDWAPLGNDYQSDTKEAAHLVVLAAAIGASGVESWIIGRAAADWGVNRAALTQVDEGEAIATSWTRVWSGVTGDVDSLYRSDARVRDTIAGVDLTGRDAIADLVRAGGRWEIATVKPDDVRGVYALLGTRDDIRVLDEVVLVVSGHDAAGCSGEMAVWLTLDDGLVAEEVRYWPIERARRCLVANDLPDGWWTDRPVPAAPPPSSRPFEDLDTPTDPVLVGDATITVYHGTPALKRLLIWGLSRFEAAGLTLPEITSATFTLYSDFCDGAWAQTQATTEGYELSFCFDDDRACWDDACAHFLPAGRLAILHELAHAWMYATLDERVEQEFIDHVGLADWNDPTTAWDQRGIEHAADTIAWGLMDREMRMVAIGDPGKEILAAGLRILTNSDPLPRTDEYSSTDLPVALE